MTGHKEDHQQDSQKQDSRTQADRQRAGERVQQTVEREGLGELDGGQGWRPPAEGGTESTAGSARDGDAGQDSQRQGTRGAGIYDSGQGSRPSTEAGELEEEGAERNEPWNG